MSAVIEREQKQTQALSQLDQLKQFTVVVADTGDFATLKEYAPRDATTSPSLILKAAQRPEYRSLLDKAIADSKNSSLSANALVNSLVDDLLVRLRGEIMKTVPGRVSTQSDTNLSLQTQALVD